MIRNDVTIATTKVQSFLKLMGSKILSVTFVKKNGEIRKLVGRSGVRKDLKGGINYALQSKYPYVCLYDFQKRAYRNVNCEKVQQIVCGGTIFKVEPVYTPPV